MAGPPPNSPKRVKLTILGRSRKTGAMPLHALRLERKYVLDMLGQQPVAHDYLTKYSSTSPSSIDDSPTKRI